MTIAILSAMPIESARIINALENRTTLGRGRTKTFGGRIAGRDVTVAVTGVGFKRAAAATRALIEEAGPVSHVIICGFAGALGGEARPGNLVISTDIVQEEEGRCPSCNILRPFSSLFPRTPARLSDPLPADARLAAAAKEAAGNVAGRFPAVPVISGRIVSVPVAVFNRTARDRIRAASGGAAVDMESGVIARVAWQNGIPFVAVRVLSDSASWSAPLQFLRRRGCLARLNQAVVQALIRRV